MPASRGAFGVLAIAALATVLARAPCRAQVPVAPRAFERHAVVCQSPDAASAGAAILARGGNAVDAAVATALALAVTFPEAGNIGGGGFLVVHVPGRAGAPPEWTTFDFRETAPARAHPRMFLDEKGEYDAARHHEGHLAVGVPGTVAGLALAQSRLGKLEWKDVVAPALELARDGFRVSRDLAASLEEEAPRLKPAPAASATFRPEGRPLRGGDLLAQPDLARTLERIAERGSREFYEGETARLIAREMERGGGWITLADLAAYRAIERPPVVGRYRGHDVVSMAPPSSGGVALIQVLGMIAGDDVAALGDGSAAWAHLLAESMRRAFADRARWLGDADQVDVPLGRLLSAEHARERRRSIDIERASRSDPASFEWPAESEETTHLSVIDGGGMAAALTTTLEDSFGARIVVPGAGFLLNNEMGDFNAVPDRTDASGLIGTAPNLAAPGKRMLSSMTPTLLVRDGEAVAALGSPGGRTIINTVLTAVIRLIDFRQPAQVAVDAPRLHHQWLPDVLFLEPGFSPDTLRLLESRGHSLRVRRGPQGSLMAITRDPASGRLEAGVDRRRADGAAAGE